LCDVGPEDGLKHDSSIHCDALVSQPKPVLNDYIGGLEPVRLRALDQALRVALALA
jgi:mRNA interferase MazF